MAHSYLLTSLANSKEKYSKLFFSAQKGVDMRFSSRTTQSIEPTGSITNCATFDLMPTPQVYGVHKIVVEMAMMITKSDGKTKPDNNAEITTVNDCLNSKIDSVKISVNSVEINSESAPQYNYQSFVKSMISLSNAVKLSTKESNNWYSDTPMLYDSSSNTGFTMRRKPFLKSQTANAWEFRDTPTSFYGELQSDMKSWNQGLLPNSKVQIRIYFAPDKFVLWAPATDKTEYKLVVSNIRLHLPVYTLVPEIYSNINSMLQESSCKYYFRETTCRSIPIPANTVNFSSQNLITGGTIPVKCVFMLVKANAFHGSYHLNPYDFRRLLDSTQDKLEQPFLQEQLRRQHQQQQQQQQQLQLQEENNIGPEMNFDRGGRGRGRRARRGGGRGARNNEVLEQNQAGVNVQEPVLEATGFIPNPYDATQDLVFLEQFQLMVDGVAADSLNEKMDRYHCSAEFWKFQEVHGFHDSLFSNGITMECFNTNNFMPSFNLSTSDNVNLNNLLPATRNANAMRAVLKFSNPLPTECLLLCFFENNKVIGIDKNKKIEISYMSID